MIELLLALTLDFHNPAFLKDSLACVPSTQPLTDLDKIVVIGQERYSTQDTVLAERNVRGREGLAESITISLPNSNQWTLTVYAVNTAGKRSCPKVIGVNETVNVSPQEPEKVQWYDVAGRKCDAPNRPGVYFRVQRGKPRKVIVITP